MFIKISSLKKKFYHEMREVLSGLVVSKFGI